MAAPPVGEMMLAYSQDAVELAQKQFQTSLDYSIASIQELERILSKQHAAMPKGWRAVFQKAPSEEVLAKFCKIWGGYLGEVIRRKWDGEWQIPTEGLFAGAVILSVRGQLLSPTARVYKRLTMGFEDGDVWGFVVVLEQRLGPEEGRA